MPALSALEQFRSQYPSTTSADLQTFILGYNAAVNEIKSQELENQQVKIEISSMPERLEQAWVERQSTEFFSITSHIRRLSSK